MHLSPEVNSKIENTYSQLAQYPCPSVLESSPLRDANAILSDLTAAPLRKLSTSQIGYYAGCAITTVGDENDYRHFLPRILELAITESCSMGLDPEVIASKIKLTNWLNWPTPQRTAIAELYRSAFLDLMKPNSVLGDDNIGMAESWLCGFVLLEQNLEPLLEEVLNSRSIVESLHFVTLIAQLGSSLADKTGHWDEIENSDRQLIASWLLSPDIEKYLSESLRNQSTENRWQVELAIASLDSFKRICL
jgi:hypothetical protein